VLSGGGEAQRSAACGGSRPLTPKPQPKTQNLKSYIIHLKYVFRAEVRLHAHAAPPPSSFFRQPLRVRLTVHLTITTQRNQATTSR